MIWQEQEIRIAQAWIAGKRWPYERSWRRVPAQVGIGSGLAYHKEENGTYTIDHIESGYAFPPKSVPTEEQAREIIEAIAPLTDWTASKEEVLESLTRGQKRSISQMIANTWIGHEDEKAERGHDK